MSHLTVIITLSHLEGAPTKLGEGAPTKSGEGAPTRSGGAPL